MKNINLKSEDLLKKGDKKSNSTVVLSIVIIGLVLSAYGVIYALNYYKLQESEKIKSEISLIEKGLSDDKYAEMYDFNMRLIDFKAKVGSQGFVPETRNIINISNNTLSTVRFEKLLVEGQENFSSYSIDIVVPDHLTLVKQIKAYKQMETVQNFRLQLEEERKDGDFLAVVSFDLGGGEETAETTSAPEKDF